MKALFALTFFAFSLATFAAARVRCELVKGRATVGATLDLATISEDGTMSDDGLDVGENNFSFSMVAAKTGSK